MNVKELCDLVYKKCEEIPTFHKNEHHHLLVMIPPSISSKASTKAVLPFKPLRFLLGQMTADELNSQSQDIVRYPDIWMHVVPGVHNDTAHRLHVLDTIQDETGCDMCGIIVPFNIIEEQTILRSIDFDGDVFDIYHVNGSENITFELRFVPTNLLK